MQNEVEQAASVGLGTYMWRSSTIRALSIVSIINRDIILSSNIEEGETKKKRRIEGDICSTIRA